MPRVTSNLNDFIAVKGEEKSACGVGAIVDLTGQPSHKILRMGVDALETLSHRVGLAPDTEMGYDDTLLGTSDGVGGIFGLFHEINQDSARRRLGQKSLWDPVAQQEKKPGLAVTFLPRENGRARSEIMNSAELIFKKNGYSQYCWRETPIVSDQLGEIGKDSHPRPEQLIIVPRHGQDRDQFNQDLYFMHREIENDVWDKGLSGEGCDNFHISSMSAYTAVYKSLSLAHRFAALYPDFQNPKAKTSVVGIHGRYSTNTAPAWWRAHFKRLMAHNGEINSLNTNINAMYKLEYIFGALFGDRKDMILKRLLNTDGADTDILDNAADFLFHAGISLPLVKILLVPPALRSGMMIEKAEKDLYTFTKSLSPGWEGPGMFVFVSGKMTLIGGDLNGMRPTPYEIFGSVDDPETPHILVAGSERGMVHNLMVPGANYSDLHKLLHEPGIRNSSSVLRKAFEQEMQTELSKARAHMHDLSLERGELWPGDMIGACTSDNNYVAGEKIPIGFLDKSDVVDIAIRDANQRFPYQELVSKIKHIDLEMPSADDFPYARVR